MTTAARDIGYRRIGRTVPCFLGVSYTGCEREVTPSIAVWGQREKFIWSNGNRKFKISMQRST